MLAAVISIAVGEGGPEAPPNEGFNEIQSSSRASTQEGAVLGTPDAPVVVKVFNDLNCIPAARTRSRRSTR